MLHLRPDLVCREALADFPSTGRALCAQGGVLGLETPVGLGWMMQDLNPEGACGNATAATAAKGERLLDQGLGAAAVPLCRVRTRTWSAPGSDSISGRSSAQFGSTSQQAWVEGAVRTCSTPDTRVPAAMRCTNQALPSVSPCWPTSSSNSLATSAKRRAEGQKSR